MKKIKIDYDKINDYIVKNKDKSIQEVYDYIKSKKLKDRLMEEHVIYTFLFTHRKKLGIK